MAVKTNNFVPQPNSQLLAMVEGEASMGYRERIPKATKSDISDTIKNLQKYRPHMNEAVDTLVNRIGMEIYGNTVWYNPLKEFKRGMLEWGDTIEEIQTGLLEAHTFDPDRDSTEKQLWGTELPPIDTSFHTVNRQDMYTITIPDKMLRRAFTSEFGLSNMLTDLMSTPTTSNEVDEYLITTRLIKEYEANGGFHKIQIPDVADTASGESDAKVALRVMRSLADTLPFVSTKYNAAKMPVHSNRDELVIITSASFKAAMDVEALAAAFNIEMAQAYGRIIVLPDEAIDVDGFQAIITTKKFFIMADTLMETHSNFNPHKIQYKYFMHHHGVYSVSRFVNAVMLTSKPVEEVIELADPVTGITAVTFENADKAVVTAGVRGDLVQVVVAATSAAFPAGLPRGGVRYVVEGTTDPLRTHVTPEGVLHVSGIEDATSITVHAFTTWIDPANPQAAPFTASKAIAVSGDKLETWPNVEEKVTDPGE